MILRNFKDTYHSGQNEDTDKRTLIECEGRFGLPDVPYRGWRGDNRFMLYRTSKSLDRAGADYFVEAPNGKRVYIDTKTRQKFNHDAPSHFYGERDFFGRIKNRSELPIYLDVISTYYGDVPDSHAPLSEQIEAAKKALELIHRAEDWNADNHPIRFKLGSHIDNNVNTDFFLHLYDHRDSIDSFMLPAKLIREILWENIDRWALETEPDGRLRFNWQTSRGMNGEIYHSAIVSVSAEKLAFAIKDYAYEYGYGTGNYSMEYELKASVISSDSNLFFHACDGTPLGDEMRDVYQNYYLVSGNDRLYCDYEDVPFIDEDWADDYVPPEKNRTSSTELLLL